MLPSPQQACHLGFSFPEILQDFYVFFEAHLLALIGFLLALIIIGRMINEKRRPSNIFAWSFLVLIFPYVGVPLYLLFGGRKSRWLVRKKKETLQLALRAAHEAAPEQSEEESLRNRFEGNAIELLDGGVAGFETFCREIENAKSCIHIMTYILGRDETGRHIRDLLIKKAREGVKVRLLIDGYGSLFASGRFIQPIRDAGGEVARFIPVVPFQTHTSANLRNHRKIAIFDYERAIVGGQNLDNRFMGARPDPDRFIDFSVLIQGPVVTALNRLFLVDWAYAAKVTPNDFREIFAHRPGPVGDSEIKVVVSGPDVEGDPLWERIITLIQECRREITIVTPYFIPDEVIFRSLMVKAHNGRKVRIVLPAVSNHRMVDLARTHYIRQLHEAGAEVLLHHAGMIHGKLFLADGAIAIIGSANVDIRSLFVNFEIGLEHTSPGDIALLQNWVDGLLKDCYDFSQSKRARQGPGRVWAEEFAHLLIPLL